MTEIFSFGEWVRRRRKALDLTQGALARRVGCAIATVRKIEADERRPSRQVAALLATALELPTSERDQFLRTARAELAPDRLASPTLPPLAASPISELSAEDGRPSRSSGNLPTRLTPVIGRAREVAELTALVRRPAVRLLTLTGPGGTGKTRLAQQVAGMLQADYPDGVWFVDLAPVSDPERVGPAIVQGLGLPESNQGESAGPDAVWQRLARWLAPKHILLVIDNFEQVLDAAPPLADLLRAAPRAQAIVTSRVALRLASEHEYPVAPLSLPQANDRTSIGQSAAIQLFVARAQAARPDFLLSDEHAHAVAAICVTLGGLPLALELAAARVRLFAPQELQARLERDGGLALLTTGARDRPARQQTIRATIAWSYQLLDPVEQHLFAQLGVFVGSWTLDLAEHVCILDDLDGDVLDSMQVLIEHSLVQSVEQPGQPRLFRMLETIRAFAHEQLISHRGEAQLRERHLAACVELAEEAEPKLRSGEQLQWFAQLDQIYENFRAALVWSLDSPDGARERRTRGLRLAGALWYYWYVRGRLQESNRWLDHPVMDDQRLPIALRAHALLSHYFSVLESGGEQDKMLTSGMRGRVLAERDGDTLLRVRGLLWSENLDDKAHGWELAQTIDDPWWQCWFNLSYGTLPMGFDIRGQRWQKVLALARQSGDGIPISRALSYLAYYHLAAGKFTMAKQLAEEEFDIVSRLNFRFGITSALFMFTRVLEAEGKVDVARAYNEQRYALECSVGNPHGDDLTFLESFLLMIWQAEYLYPTTLFAKIAQDARFLWTRQTIAWAQGWLAIEQGHSAEALTHIQEALSNPLVSPVTYPACHQTGSKIAACWLRGTIATSQGLFEEAIISYEQSVEIVQTFTSDEQNVVKYWLQSIVLAFSGPVIVALSGLGRIAAYHPDPIIARHWLTETIAAIRATTGIWETTITRAVWGTAYLGWGEYTAAAAQLTDDLRFYQKAGARRMIAETLEGVAICACAQGRWEQAVRWWGAADHLRADIGAPMWPCDRPRYEHWVSAARVTLGAEVFDQIWTAGRSMPWTQVAAEACGANDIPGA